MSYFLFLAVFAASLVSPAIGVAIVLFNLSTLVFSWSSVTVAGGIVLKLSDAALIGLAVWLFWNWRGRLQSWERPFVMVLVCFAAAGFWRLCVGSADPTVSRICVAYNMVVRFGLLWILPIVVARCRQSARAWILGAGAVFCVGVGLAQIYAYKTADASFIVSHFQGLNAASEQMIEHVTAQGESYKVVAPGIILCFIAFFIALAGSFFISAKTPFRLICAALAVGILSFVIVAFRSKSFFATACLGIVAISALKPVFANAGWFRSVLVLCCMPALALLAGALFERQFVEATMARFDEDFSIHSASIGGRLGANLVAADVALSFPIFGFGRENLPASFGASDYAASVATTNDGHAFVMLAAFAGLPTALLATWALGGLLYLVPWKHLGNLPWLIVGYLGGIVATLCLALTNATPLFNQPFALAPFLIVCGLLVAELEVARASKPIGSKGASSAWRSGRSSVFCRKARNAARRSGPRQLVPLHFKSRCV